MCSVRFVKPSEDEMGGMIVIDLAELDDEDEPHETVKLVKTPCGVMILKDGKCLTLLREPVKNVTLTDGSQVKAVSQDGGGTQTVSADRTSHILGVRQTNTGGSQTVFAGGGGHVSGVTQTITASGGGQIIGARQSVNFGGEITNAGEPASAEKQGFRETLRRLFGG